MIPDIIIAPIIYIMDTIKLKSSHFTTTVQLLITTEINSNLTSNIFFRDDTVTQQTYS